MARSKPVKPEDPIMGGYTAHLLPCPLPPIVGWAWVEWCDPPQVCSLTNTDGHRTGWRRTAGPDAGKFFCPQAGPQELPEEKPKRKKADDDGAPVQVSRTVTRTRRKAA
jgi:hypothetical protein